MDKSTLLKKVEGGYTKQQLKSWVQALPRTLKKPEEPKIGDVYMHDVFLHPYLILSKKKSTYICCLLTSEDSCKEILEKCKSRFLQDEFITKTLFTVTEVNLSNFISTYDNNRHLKEIFNKLKLEF